MIMKTFEGYTEAEVEDHLLRVHEAGHFVACIDGDIPVELIKLERSWWSGERTRGYNLLGDRYVDADPIRMARMIMCGRAAEETWLDRHPGHGVFRAANAGSDHAHLQELVRDHPGDITVTSALAAARLFVATNWFRITALAEALEHRDRMSARQAARPVRTARRNR